MINIYGIMNSKSTKIGPLRLIGIDLECMECGISKNLKPGWYLFGHFKEPVSGYLAYIFHTHPRKFPYEECCSPNRLK